MFNKYSNFVSSNPNHMKKPLVDDFKTFLLKENTENEETIGDGKDVKLFWTLETKRIEIPVGSEEHTKNDDKNVTFEKIIKRITKLSKFIKLPVPILKKLETKKYYTFVSYGEHSVKYWYEVFSNGKNYTDDINEIERVKSNLTTKLGGKYTPWRITSKDVDVYDLTMATVIKPEDEWIILGTFDYVDDLLKPAPGQQIPLDMVNMSKSECDHCKKNIYRKKTVFIKKIKDGSILKVGGTCIKNYLGYDYEKVLSYLTDISFINESWDNSDGGFNDYEYDGMSGGRGIEDEVSVKEIIRYYIWWYKNKGYISRSTAEKLNTKKMEEWNSENPDKDPVYRTIKEVICTGDAVRVDVNYANQTIRGGKEDSETQREWIENVYAPRLATISDTDPQIQTIIDFINNEASTGNNFMFNVSNMIKMGFVKNRLSNYITGACSYFFGKLHAEEMKRKTESGETNKVSEWVGKVGEKIKLENLEVVHISGFEGGFGWTNVYKLKDQNGNSFTKFGTISADKFVVKPTENDRIKDEKGKLIIDEIKVGDILSATAEIKKHDEYMGKKQTVLGRFSKL